MFFRRIKICTLAVALAALSFFAGGCFLLPTEEEILAPPLVEPEEIVYKTEAVKRGDIQDKRTITAYFVPLINHNLFFTKASGRVQTFNVVLGSEVQEGDILIELENEGVLKRIRDQELTVKKLESRLNEAKNSASDRYAIKTAELDLQAANNAYLDLVNEKTELMLRDSYESRPDLVEQVENLDKKIRDQMIQLEKLELKLSQLKSQQGGFEAEQAEYELQSAQNALNDLQAEYENTVLRAPINGRVTWIKTMNIGESVGTYSTVVTIADPTQLVLQYDNSKASEFPVGMEVTIVCDKVEYTGRVESNPLTNPLKDDGSRNDYARFSIDNFDSAMAATGMSAQVSAILDSREDVVIISKNRVNSFQSRYYVNLLVDGLKEERDIQLGLQTATEVEVVKGLVEGEMLITN